MVNIRLSLWVSTSLVYLFRKVAKGCEPLSGRPQCLSYGQPAILPRQVLCGLTFLQLSQASNLSPFRLDLSLQPSLYIYVYIYFLYIKSD